MKRLALLTTLAALGAFAHAQLSGNLYLAQANDGGTGIVDQEFGDFPDYSTGAGNVVTFATSVQLADVQTRLTDSGTWIADGVNSGRLTISKFDGSAPSTQHTPGGASSGSDIVYDGVLSATMTNVSGTLFNFVGDASLVPVIDAGTYFVTFTGIADFGAHGQAFHMESSDTSVDSWARNPGGSFGLSGGTDWFKTSLQSGWPTQISLGINGKEAVPEPATMAVLAAGAALLARRRRK
ncbi:MAG: PEP-CTERM sorting domain-containing protein [Fimbriimonadaceae bacterium]|nr:PEP-CTERM sorting domain-containing protein [Fimbriimonadaceae bacterium]